MTSRFTPFALIRLGLLAALLSFAAAPHAAAQYTTYNGALVVRVPAARPVILNSSVVVFPFLTGPSQIQIITRAQGAITRNLLALHSGGVAVLTFGNNTASPNVVRGVYVTTTANLGSTILVTLTSGNPTGTLLFHIQPGATNCTMLLTPAGHGAIRYQFTGVIPPNPYNP
jgi:hypothetical protein